MHVKITGGILVGNVTMAIGRPSQAAGRSTRIGVKAEDRRDRRERGKMQEKQKMRKRRHRRRSKLQYQCAGRGKRK
jgi:hypothetical protein